MPRGRQPRAEYSDPSTSGDDMNDESVKPVIDPKVALQLADLGNAARDRQTSHDEKKDQPVNFAQLNRTRKCNQEGTEEAEKAAANQSKITSWNNFGGQDSSTNLAPIAGGQYHRLTTALKVQTEIRQLRIDGKEITAESIDAPRGHASKTYGTQTGHVRGRGGGFIGSGNRSRLQLSQGSGDARSFLDPALDPGRGQRHTRDSNNGNNYRDADRGRSAGRGGRAMGRGGHAMQVGRGTLSTKFASSDDLRSSSSANNGTTTSGIGLGGRAAAQRKFQERPWPPMALAGNIEPPPRAIDGSGLSNVNQTAEIEQHATENRANNVTEAVRSLVPTTVQAAPATLKSPPAQVLPTPKKPAPCESGLTSQQVNPKPELAKDFSEWFRAATPSLLVSGTTRVQPTTRTKPPSAVADETVKISRESFVRDVNTRVQSSEGQRTDGRLSPVSFPGELDASAPSTTSIVAERRHRDLLDFEIPSDEQAALRQPREHTGSSISSPSHASLRSSTAHGQNSVAAASDQIKSKDAGTASVADIAVAPKFTLITSKFASPSALQNRSPNVASNNVVSTSKTSTSSTVLNPLASSSVGRLPNVPQHPTASLLGDDTVSRGRTTNRQSDFHTFATRSTLGDEGNLRPRIAEVPTKVLSPIHSILGDDTNLRLRATAKTNIKNSLSQSKYAQEPQESEKPQKPISRHEAGAGYAILLRELAEKNIAINQARRPDEPAFSTVRAQPSGLFTQYREPAYNDNTSDDDEL